MANPTIACAIAFRGAPVLCWQSEFKTGSGVVWAQTGALGGSDPATTSRPRFRQQSGWISVAGILGPQRVRRLWMLGTFPSATTLAIYYNYAGSATETKSGFGTGVSAQQVEIQLPQQDCHAVRFELIGHTRLVAWRLEAEAEKGTHRRSATRV